MRRQEQDDPWDKRGGPARTPQREPELIREDDLLVRKDDLEDELLPTIALVHVPHPKIPNLFQCCFEYVERWQWSSEAELVETGRWFFGRHRDGA